MFFVFNDFQCQSRTQAQKELTALAISNFPIPGDSDFPLNGMFAKPSPGEVGSFRFDFDLSPDFQSMHLDKLKQYLEQLRKECSDRMVDRVIDPETDKPSKVDLAKSISHFHLIALFDLVVALFCSSPFHGQEFIEHWYSLDYLLLSKIRFQRSFLFYETFTNNFQRACSIFISSLFFIK